MHKTWIISLKTSLAKFWGIRVSNWTYSLLYVLYPHCHHSCCCKRSRAVLEQHIKDWKVCKFDWLLIQQLSQCLFIFWTPEPQGPKTEVLLSAQPQKDPEIQPEPWGKNFKMWVWHSSALKYLMLSETDPCPLLAE